MKYTIWMAVLGAALGLTGCSELVSLNPMAAEGDAKVDPALPGVWQNGDDLFVIRQDGAGYRIVFVSKDSAKMFRGVLFQAGDVKLLDIAPEEEDPFQVRVHAVARVWTEPSKLRWAFLDADWMKDQARQSLPVQAAGERTLLTGASPVVRGFVRKFAGDERAHKEITVLERVQ